MFSETVNHPGGSTQGNASESHALMLLRRGLNRGCRIEATSTGGVEICWTRVDLSQMVVLRSIALAPLTPVDTMDEEKLSLLARLDGVEAHYEVRANWRAITIEGGGKLSPLDTARLRARRLVEVDGKNRVRLTLAARLGLLAGGHIQTGGGSDGLAMCSCGVTVNAASGEEADAAMRGHREKAAAQFVESISATYAAAITSTH